ncbi:MAG: dephospho-CoA kinase [Bacteroidales bacterium]|nr:dephospho-CoA kinase [Candidatus Cacconaster merdequi]
MEGSKVILCTGGIGSGKSCIVKAFNLIGVPSYDTDSAAKRLYDTDAALLEEIASIAGADILKDGKLDKPLFAQRIFSDRKMLEEVEAAVHPAVMRDFEKWKSAQESEVVMIESAIILEKPQLRSVADYVLAVSLPEEIRVRRVMARDHTTAQAVRVRMAKQWDDAQREAYADFVLVPDDKHQLLPEILKIKNLLTGSDKIVKNGKDRS